MVSWIVTYRGKVVKYVSFPICIGGSGLDAVSIGKRLLVIGRLEGFGMPSMISQLLLPASLPSEYRSV